jgi:hypothetical protein
MALRQPSENVAQSNLETSVESGIRPAVEVPGRVEFQQHVLQVLAFSKATLAADPRLAEVMKNLKN